MEHDSEVGGTSFGLMLMASLICQEVGQELVCGWWLKVWLCESFNSKNVKILLCIQVKKKKKFPALCLLSQSVRHQLSSEKLQKLVCFIEISMHLDTSSQL